MLCLGVRMVLWFPGACSLRSQSGDGREMKWEPSGLASACAVCGWVCWKNPPWGTLSTSWLRPHPAVGTLSTSWLRPHPAVGCLLHGGLHLQQRRSGTRSRAFPCWLRAVGFVRMLVGETYTCPTSSTRYRLPACSCVCVGWGGGGVVQHTEN